MAGFGFGSRKDPPGEEQEASNGSPAVPEREASNGSPEVPERVASLRDLDEKIRRRDGELRSSKEAGRASPRTESTSSVGARMAATVEDARKEIFKLAGRVEALESGIPETERRNWEALQEQQELVDERLGELEKLAARIKALEKGAGGAQGAFEERLAGLERAADDAHAGATEAGAQADGRLEKLATRINALEKLPERGETLDKLSERLETLDERLGAVRDESRSSLKEVRSAQRPLEERLAGLEKAANDVLAQATEAGAQADGRLEKLAARVEALEKLPERLDAVDQEVASAREIADGAHAQHKPLAARVTELEALERKAASGSRKLEQRAVETMESLAARTELAEVVGRLSARVAALDRRLSQTEKESAHTQERLANSGVELNEATFEQLRGLGLSATQAARVISARDGLGGFTSSGQLDEIPGLPEKDLQELKRGVRLSAGDGGAAAI